MKRYTTFIVCCLAMFLSAESVFAQGGQQSIPGQIIPAQNIPGQVIPGQIIPGQIYQGQTIIPGQQIIPGQYGYGLQTVPVVQAWAYGHKMPIVIQGNIVQFYGGKDLYIFRDSSGDVLVKIGNKEWQTLWYQGISIATTDTLEIYGEVHWPKNSRIPEVHARYIRKL